MTATPSEELLKGTKGDATVIFITGKGGVGKSTLAKLLTKTAQQAGMRSLMIVLDDSAELDSTPIEPSEEKGSTASFSTRGGGETTDVEEESLSARGGDPEVMRLDPNRVLHEYLEDHNLANVASRLIANGIFSVVALAIPGIKDLLTLGKIKQLERGGEYDMIVVDAPASGHAMSFLRSPQGLAEIARSGPLRSQSEDVLEMLKDPLRAGVVIVTIPEETPIQEAIETSVRLQSETELKLHCIVVNQVMHSPDPSTEEVQLALRVGKNSKNSLIAAMYYRLSLSNLAERHLGQLRGAWSGKLFELPHIEQPSQNMDVVDMLVERLTRMNSPNSEEGPSGL